MNEGRFIKVWDHRRNQSSLPVYAVADARDSSWKTGLAPLTAREIYLSPSKLPAAAIELQKIAVKRDLILDFPWRTEIGVDRRFSTEVKVVGKRIWRENNGPFKRKEGSNLNWNVYKFVICKMCIKESKIYIQICNLQDMCEICVFVVSDEIKNSRRIWGCFKWHNR